MRSQFQTTIEQRQRVLLACRTILQPISNQRQMEKSKTISAQISHVGNFSLRRSVGENFSNEPQIPKVLLLGRQAERIEARRGLQRAQVDRSDELFVWAKPIEQTMNDGEEFLGQTGFLDALVALIPIHDVRQFLLEEVQGEVFLGFEIINRVPSAIFAFREMALVVV